MTICRGRAVLLAAALAVAVLAAGAEWRDAAPGHVWEFPRDHWAHAGYRTEWWYFTGHLHAEEDPSQEFGYQFTVFKVGLLPERPPHDSAWTARNLFMGHAAVTDLRGKTHGFSEVLYREIPLLAGFAGFPDRPIAWSRGPAGTDGTWELDWDGSAFSLSMADDGRGIALDLTARPLRDPVLHGAGGLSRKSRDARASSLYYSLTRLETRGWLMRGGRTWTVRGESWMDKEFSSSMLGAEQVGWDWLALRLADGRDLMLYVVRREDGSADYRSGTLVAAAGEPRELRAGEWSVQATRTWTSPSSEAVYPSRWLVEIPGEGIRLEVEPDLDDQENRSASGIVYWEGSVTVRASKGSLAGRGYAELTGYARDSRPPM